MKHKAFTLLRILSLILILGALPIGLSGSVGAQGPETQDIICCSAPCILRSCTICCSYPPELPYCACTLGWGTCSCREATAITLLSFTAEAGADYVTLAWETGTEVDNAGFNLWRGEAADGPYTKLNDALIPAEGDPVSGASYAYTDTDVVKGVTYYYKLEDVDIHGVSTFHGPVSATPSPSHRIYLPLIFK